MHDKEDLNLLTELLGILKQKRVKSYSNGQLKIEFEESEPPKALDPDDRGPDGHRLKPPSKVEVEQERLEQW